LADDDDGGKNWRGIIISILVILFVFGLVVIAIIIVSPSLLHSLFSTGCFKKVARYNFWGYFHFS